MLARPPAEMLPQRRVVTVAALRKGVRGADIVLVAVDRATTPDLGRAIDCAAHIIIVAAVREVVRKAVDVMACTRGPPLLLEVRPKVRVGRRAVVVAAA